MKIIKKFYKHFIIFSSTLLIADWTVGVFFQNQEDTYLDAQTELLQDIYLMHQENKKLISLLSS